MEYASELWSPYTLKHQMILENVQRRATKFILNYPNDLNYKQRLLKLSLLPLEYRRDSKDTILLFKHRLGLIVLDHPSLQQCSAQYRVITRNFSSLNYKTQRATQNYLKYSYFHRVVSTWNSLPLDIKSSTNLVTFKKAISDYYTMKLDSYILPDERRT